MSRYGVTPNMMVMPPQMLLYMALAPEAKLTCRPSARTRSHSESSARSARSGTRRAVRRRPPPSRPAWRASRRAPSAAAASSRCARVRARARACVRVRARACVVARGGARSRARARAQSEPFEVSDDQDSVQMLTRSTQIGEFYVMQPPQVNPGKDNAKFTSDIMIYDEEADRHVRIQWIDAVGACCIKDTAMKGSNGAESVIVGTETADTIVETIQLHGKETKNTTGDWRDEAIKVATFNAGINTNGTAYAAGDAGDAQFNAHYQSLDTDLRIVVARPFIEHLMHSVIIAVSGRDTGATLFGPAGARARARARAQLQRSSRLRPWRWQTCSCRPTRRSKRLRVTTPATSRP